MLGRIKEGVIGRGEKNKSEWKREGLREGEKERAFLRNGFQRWAK